MVKLGGGAVVCHVCVWVVGSVGWGGRWWMWWWDSGCGGGWWGDGGVGVMDVGGGCVVVDVCYIEIYVAKLLKVTWVVIWQCST